MTNKIYLTIDDSPSKNTDAIVDFLCAHKIPAIFFVRGAFMEQPDKFAKIIRAITKGFIIGNHTYNHERASVIGFDKQIDEITKTQILIERAYTAAGKVQPFKIFRFPHLDRGCGNAFVADFEKFLPEYKNIAQQLFRDGVRLENEIPPHAEQIKLKNDIQQWLKDNGFIKLSTPLVKHKWFVDTELGEAIDALITYSTADWMILPRHIGKWPYKNIDDLFNKIDNDQWLNDAISANIVLMHDYDDDQALSNFREIIKYFIDNDFEFIDFNLSV